MRLICNLSGGSRTPKTKGSYDGAEGMVMIISPRRIVAMILVLLLAWGGFAPTRVEPVAWEPKPSPGFYGRFKPNASFSTLELFPTAAGYGPETIAVGPDGYLYAGLMGGAIVRFRPDGSQMETWASTSSRPNGMEFDPSGNLILTDSWKGLLSISPERNVTVLATSADGTALGFPDDLTIASDGTVWFTDGSARFGDGESHYDALEGIASGRLLSYDPKTGSIRTRMDGLRFANGIAFGPAEEYILVNESLGYRTLRHWLKGPRTGETEVFVDNYPGFPDNIRFNGKDTFWIALFSHRIAALDWIQPHPFLKKVLSRFGALFPHTDTEWFASPGSVIGVDLEGHIVHTLQDEDGRFLATTTALEHDGHLYLGSVVMPAVGRLRLLSARSAKMVETGRVDGEGLPGRVAYAKAVAFRQQLPDSGQPTAELPTQTFQARLDLSRNGEKQLVVFPSVQGEHGCLTAHPCGAR
jgi:sugar lactone lactonase YvrE